MNRNYTIGLLIDWIENSYHLSLLNGVGESVKKNNINLLSFVGGAINSERLHEAPRNIVYEYANKGNVDGIIMLTGSIGHFCGVEELNTFVEKFSPLPVVSISQQLKNAYSLLVDNTTGLRDLINHLILDHGYKKNAFIKGPDGNQEAEIRFNVYRETLKQNGIEFNENYVANGAFIIDSGIEAVKRFLDKNKLEIDVIVAANNDMAIGAMKELHRRKIIVPHDIAVTGFDDQPTSQFTMPSLTTVEQNLYTQGQCAVEMIIDILNGEEVERVITLPTAALMRESCGCSINHQYEIPVQINSETKAPEVKNKKIEEIINNELDKVISDNLIPKIKREEINDILSIFTQSIENKNINLLYGKIQEILLKYNEISEELFADLFNVLDLIKEAIKGKLDEKDTNVINDFINCIKLYIYQHVLKKIEFNKFKEDIAILLFRDVGEEFVGFLTMDEIINVMVREFPNLEIKACYFSLYENQIQDNVDLHSAMSRLMLAYYKKSIRLRKDDIIFKSIDLLPKNLLNDMGRWSLVVEPLFFGNTQLGMALLDFNPQKGFTYNVMRRMFIFNAFRNAVYVQKILSQSRHLEDTLNKLKETQTKLIQSEKMSALGGLVAGISHEINTPIGIGVTAASHLEKITKGITVLFSNQKMKKSYFDKYISSANEASMMILSNLKRAYELISSFKQVAVDQSNEQKRQFNVKQYWNQILLSLKPKLKKTEHTINIKCQDTLEITTFPGAFSQIITNFIMNSLVHAFKDGVKGIMHIEINTEKNNLILKYKDNGKGIEPSIVNKIFDPFFTTIRGQGGTGLGLNVVYNIVSQTLKGNIKCSSNLDKGTSFTVIFPIDN